MNRWLARSLGLVIGLGLLFPVAAAIPQPAMAANSCTGWGSTTTPPTSIRVLRTSSGAVQEVDFRRYVLVVMGKEWGAYLPTEVLKAGAQAVKQFAWYHSLEGRHRSSYYSGGKCYDVKDSTADQLYKPEGLTISDKHRAIVDAIWGLSLRKSDKFILTQYRTGQQDVACGADADGTKLYARSAIKCAKAGWDYDRILAKYYSPNLNLTWSGTGGTGSTAVTGSFSGTVSVPRSLFRPDVVVSSAPVLTNWKPTNAVDKIASYQVQRRVSGTWKTVGTQAANDTNFDLGAKWGSNLRFRVRALNSAGAAGAWSKGPAFSPRRVDDRNSRLKWSGSWNRTSDGGAVKGTTTSSSQAGATVSYTFTGRAISVVGTRGPDRGRARIYINGNLIGMVDLYQSNKQAGIVLYSHSWARSKTRTIKVVVVDTDSRPRVDIDAFLRLN